MQAFRAAATIDAQGALHIPGLPFRPGTTVEVIVLEPELTVPRSASVASPRLANPEDMVHFRLDVQPIAEDSADADL